MFGFNTPCKFLATIHYPLNRTLLRIDTWNKHNMYLLDKVQFFRLNIGLFTAACVYSITARVHEALLEALPYSLLLLAGKGMKLTSSKIVASGWSVIKRTRWRGRLHCWLIFKIVMIGCKNSNIEQYLSRSFLYIYIVGISFSVNCLAVQICGLKHSLHHAFR